MTACFLSLFCLEMETIQNHIAQLPIFPLWN